MFFRMITISFLVAVSCQLKNTHYHDEAAFNGIPLSEITKNSTRIKRSDFKPCLTDTAEQGECVPYYLCVDGVSITDGSGVIDLRSGFPDEAGNVEEDPCHYLDVCCKPPDMRDENDPIKPKPDQHTGCGWRNPDGLGFKITGNRNNEAEFGEFPWMVAILKLVKIGQPPYFKSATYYIGGGSLIHPSVVLTAAHILDTTGLRVRAGEWDTQTEGEQYPYQERDVAEVDVHEEFNEANVYYDAALLFLTAPFDLAPNVGLACIPIPGEPLDMSGECFAAGWGKNKFGKEGQYQNILKKIDLHLVDHDTCQARLRTTRLQKYFKLHSSFICAGGEGEKDTCTGDGGSPLVCPIQSQPNRYKQVGIVSWGVQCGQEGMPAVYADVTTIGGWVDRRLMLRGLDVSLYRY